MKRAVVTGLTLAVVSLFVACGFPDVSYTDGADAGGGADSSLDTARAADGTDSNVDGTMAAPDGPDSEASSDPDVGAGDGSDSSSSADSPSTDAPVDVLQQPDSAADASTDASGSSDGTADSGSPQDATYDAVEDTVLEAAPDAPPDANPCDQDGDGYLSDSTECHGNDCCDTDPNANPGDTQYWDVPDKCGSFDYDCNGKDDLEYTQGLQCSGLSVTGCTGTGFTGEPGCGGQGPYGSCAVSGLKCAIGPVVNETQYCR